MTKPNKQLQEYKDYANKLIQTINDKMQYNPEPVLIALKNKYPEIKQNFLDKIDYQIFDIYKQYILDTFDKTKFKAKPVLDAFEKKYDNLTTRSSKLSAFKRLILCQIKIRGYKDGYDYVRKMKAENEDFPLIPREVMKLKLELNEIRAVKKHQSKRLTEQLNNQITINNSKLIREKLTKMIEITREQIGLPDENENKLEGRNDYETHLFHSLLFMSGRRTNEILSPKTQFKRINGKKKSVVFIGQSKTNNSTPYEIPLVFNKSHKNPARLFQRVFKDFQSIMKYKYKNWINNNHEKSKCMTIAEIVNIVNKKFAENAFRTQYYWMGDNNQPSELDDGNNRHNLKTNSIALYDGAVWNYITNYKKLPKEIQDDLYHITPHFYRSLYAKFAFDDNETGNMSFNAFLKQVLGHDNNNANLHYIKIVLQ